MMSAPDAVEFQLGDEVAHRTDTDDVGIVTGITFRPGTVTYEVTWGCHSESTHYGIELQKHRSTETAGA